MAGIVLTVHTRPGVDLAVHVAIDRARPGDVVVGDEDGLLVIPRARLAQAVAEGEEVARREATRLTGLAAHVIESNNIDATAHLAEDSPEDSDENA